MKALTILFLFISGFISAQSGIIIGQDTLYSNQISITPAYTSLNGRKLSTADVELIEVNGKWLTKPQYFGLLSGQGDPREIVKAPMKLTSGEYLMKAASQSQLGITLVIISSLAGALIEDDAGIIIASLGGIAGIVLSISAWGNIRKAGLVSIIAGQP